MYIQRGRVEIAVTSKTDKDAVVAILGPGNFLGKAALQVRPLVRRALPPLHLPSYK